MAEEKNIDQNLEQKNEELKGKIEQHFFEDSHITEQPITNDQQPSTENMEVLRAFPGRNAWIFCRKFARTN